MQVGNCDFLGWFKVSFGYSMWNLFFSTKIIGHFKNNSQCFDTGSEGSTMNEVLDPTLSKTIKSLMLMNFEGFQFFLFWNFF